MAQPFRVKAFCSHDGHEFYAEGDYCPSHGAPIFKKCDHCRKPWEDRVMVSYTSYAAVPFCIHCSYPAPWVPRKDRIEWIKQRLKDDQLDSVATLHLGEILDKLAKMEPTDTKTVQAWRKIKRMAPNAWKAAQPILDTILSAAVRLLIDSDGRK